jgi:ubiquinone/menaquinone biosynthesis C-methylase UbiE
MSSQTTAAANYTAQSSESYLAQREGAVSDHVQSMRAFLFADIAQPGMRVLDFGCGTGGILERLDCSARIGIEIGEAAAQIARDKGIEVHSSLADVPDNSVDAAISFHAVEHVEAPAEILRALARVAKPGAPLRLIVPGENPHDARQAHWRPNRDLHLFTWTPLLFGNLAQVAGLCDIRTRIEPMPTGSRLVRYLAPVPPLARLAHHRIATRLNSWNVILDCRAPDA